MKSKLLKTIIICLCLIILNSFAVFAAIWLSKPVYLDYDECKDSISVEIIDDYLYVFYDYKVDNINYLANDNGTVFLHNTEDDTGRCYSQSIQVTTTRWHQILKKKTVLYKREIGSFGAISGESNIINEDETITVVPRYDVKIYFRDASGDEHMIWYFTND